jgi:signal peptidase I
MDGRAHERDELDETQDYPRFGPDPTPVDDAYADEVRPDPGAGPLPHRFSPADPAPAEWGEPDPDDWRPADPVRTTPSWGDRGYPEEHGGALPSYSRLPYESVPYERPGYGARPSYGQPGYGQPDYDAPAGAQPAFNQVPAQQGYGVTPSFDTGLYATTEPGPDSLPQWRGGYGADEPGTDSGGYPAIAFGGVLDRAEDRSLTAAADSTGENLGRHGGGGDLLPVRTRRTARLGRVSDEDGEAEPGRTRRSMPLWQELPLLLVVAFCLAVLIRTFLLQAFFIPSGSMEQTLLVGDRVLVNKIVYDVRPPERGEVVVFRGTDSWAPENFEPPSSSLLGRIGRTMGDLVGVSRPGEKDFIKRVIGLPGDRVSCCDPSGRVYVNGQGIDEPYVLNNSPIDVPPDPRVCRSRRFDEVLVPPGQIFVMGDHRIVSQDARCQGPVPIEDVIGRAFVIVWPSSRWDTLDVPDTFANVPGPIALGPPGSTGANVRVGAAVITLPILASLVVTTRWGRKPRWGRRTLRR